MIVCFNFADGLQLKDDVVAISGRACEFLPSTRRLNVVGEKKLSEKPPYRLAFLGRWHRNKGVDLLLDALGLIDETVWEIIEEIRICGGGPMEGIVNEKIANLKNLDRPVDVRGYLNKDKAVELLMWADYVLIPSRIESIPVIFSDAMKCGCPVISMPVGDLPRLVQDYGVGIIAKTITGQGFSSAISQIPNNPPKYFEVGMQRVHREFDLDNVSEFLLSKLLK